MSPAYHLGRVVAHWASLAAATGGGWQSRYYTRVLDRPRLEVGTFQRMMERRLSGLAKREPGLAFYYQGRLAADLAAVPELPERLSPEEQGQFSLGYYQCIAEQRKIGEDGQAAPRD